MPQGNMFNRKLKHLPDQLQGVKDVRDIGIVCPIDILVGIDVESATHSIKDCHVPKKKTAKKLGVTGLICSHCHNSGL